MNPAPDSKKDDAALMRDATGHAIANPSAADAVTAQSEAADVGDLIRAALLNGSDHLTLRGHDVYTSSDVYDGHVPLALDADILPAIDATLDLLMASTDLFDVPTFDFGHTSSDVGDT
jgi:hypothetical protein